MKTYEGEIQAKGLKFAIVVSRFNDFITSKLLDSAVEALLKHGAEKQNIEVITVPGSFELPLAAKKIIEKKSPDAVICLGAVIRGATPHFGYVSSEAARGIAFVSLETGIPVTFGVITADTLEQAIERSGDKSSNKGWDAALAAVEMAQLLKKL